MYYKIPILSFLKGVDKYEIERFEHLHVLSSFLVNFIRLIGTIV